MENGIEISKQFKTSDLPLASYLYASGIELISVDRTNPRRCVFVFNQPDPELLTKWKEGSAPVNALAFYNATNTLKRLIFTND